MSHGEQEALIDCWTAGAQQQQRTNVGSDTLSAYVESWIHNCLIIFFKHCFTIWSDKNKVYNIAWTCWETSKCLLFGPPCVLCDRDYLKHCIQFLETVLLMPAVAAMSTDCVVYLALLLSLDLGRVLEAPQDHFSAVLVLLLAMAVLVFTSLFFHVCMRW